MERSVEMRASPSHCEEEDREVTEATKNETDVRNDEHCIPP